MAAGLAPTLVIAAWLIAEALEPASYDPISQTVSVLAGYGGTHRWILTGALYAAGACYVLTGAGLRAVRPRARVGLVVAGLAAIGVAASPEPAQGTTLQHAVFAAIGVVTTATWPAFVARRGSPPSAIVSVRVSTAVTAVFVAMLGWLIVETQGGSALGLAERVNTSIQICWPLIVAFAVRRTARPADAAERPALTRP